MEVEPIVFATKHQQNQTSLEAVYKPKVEQLQEYLTVVHGARLQKRTPTQCSNRDSTKLGRTIVFGNSNSSLCSLNIKCPPPLVLN